MRIQWPLSQDVAGMNTFSGQPYWVCCCAAEVSSAEMFPLTWQCPQPPGHGPGLLYCERHGCMAFFYAA